MEEKSEKEIEEGWFVRQEKENQENVDSQGQRVFQGGNGQGCQIC